MPRLVTRTTAFASLVLLAVTARSSETSATPKHTEVADDPRSFARTMINFDAVEPAFLYCWVDIAYLAKPDTENCQVTIARRKVLAEASSIVPMQPDDLCSLRLVLDEFHTSFQEK